MKKMMFNDRFGLTEAVLQGRKTVTRRAGGKIRGLEDAIRCGFTRFDYKTTGNLWLHNDKENGLLEYAAPYKIGEIVAVAQSYFDIWSNLVDIGDSYTYHGCKGGFINAINYHYKGVHHSQLSGWTNKMFVKAKLMPRKIRILDVRAERLQDITEEDCLSEGISITHTWDSHDLDSKEVKRYLYGFSNSKEQFKTAREAFSALIDKISGKGTWERNPWVWRIEFELIK